MSRIIRSYIVDIVETDDAIYCDKDGHITYNIEAVENELVRCKDCKKQFTNNCYMIYGKKMMRNLFDNDFCSYGERRE